MTEAIAPITGRIFPAGSSRRVPATLTIEKGHVRVTDLHGHELALSRLANLSFDPPVGHAPRRITFRDGTLFETDDHAGVEQFESDGPGRILHRYERFNKGLIAVVLGCFAGMFVVWKYALPALVAIAVWMTPPVMQAKIDAGTLKTIDLAMAEPTKLGEEERARAEALFAMLLEEVDGGITEDFRFRLLFRDMPGVGPNAFALPGGTIILTDALVRTFPDDDVIGGILAHEIGHVVEQHGLESLYQSLGIYILIAVIAGDTGPIIDEILLEGNVLIGLAGSRAHEREADDFGIRLADRAGLDPAGLLEFFERMPEDGSGWMSTHPGSEERSDKIRDYLDTR